MCDLKKTAGSHQQLSLVDGESCSSSASLAGKLESDVAVENMKVAF